LPSFLFMLRRPPPPPLFPYTTLFRSIREPRIAGDDGLAVPAVDDVGVRRAMEARGKFRAAQFFVGKDGLGELRGGEVTFAHEGLDRKSTRLNSSHVSISYAVFCLKKK